MISNVWTHKHVLLGIGNKVVLMRCQRRYHSDWSLHRTYSYTELLLPNLFLHTANQLAEKKASAMFPLLQERPIWSSENRSSVKKQRNSGQMTSLTNALCFNILIKNWLAFFCGNRYILSGYSYKIHNKQLCVLGW